MCDERKKVVNEGPKLWKGEWELPKPTEGELKVDSFDQAKKNVTTGRVFYERVRNYEKYVTDTLDEMIPISSKQTSPYMAMFTRRQLGFRLQSDISKLMTLIETMLTKSYQMVDMHELEMKQIAVNKHQQGLLVVPQQEAEVVEFGLQDKHEQLSRLHLSQETLTDLGMKNLLVNNTGRPSFTDSVVSIERTGMHVTKNSSLVPELVLSDEVEENSEGEEKNLDELIVGAYESDNEEMEITFGVPTVTVRPSDKTPADLRVQLLTEQLSTTPAPIEVIIESTKEQETKEIEKLDQDNSSFIPELKELQMTIQSQVLLNPELSDGQYCDVEIILDRPLEQQILNSTEQVKSFFRKPHYTQYLSGRVVFLNQSETEVEISTKLVGHEKDGQVNWVVFVLRPGKRIGDTRTVNVHFNNEIHKIRSQDGNLNSSLKLAYRVKVLEKTVHPAKLVVDARMLVLWRNDAGRWFFVRDMLKRKWVKEWVTEMKLNESFSQVLSRGSLYWKIEKRHDHLYKTYKHFFLAFRRVEPKENLTHFLEIFHAAIDQYLSEVFLIELQLMNEIQALGLRYGTYVHQERWRQHLSASEKGETMKYTSLIGRNKEKNDGKRRFDSQGQDRDV